MGSQLDTTGQLLWLQKKNQLLKSLWENGPWLPFSVNSVDNFLMTLLAQSLVLGQFYKLVAF